ncbi:MAG: GTP 3',8-cyclase MoaA [Micavibrio aeruginosavorus]|uniref:GTP 3',8-cyclase n=1 Tax=Micavibrio aeruginosavorus TaxID=349221 RepID=A0A7T5R4J7_9BACT|nr:MAG: GTP 3',8-cyclase MoaA [Micavibrio aeruginosavorus]
MNHPPLIGDRFGRRFPYLRLSVTDVCNFRCSYCLPDGYQKAHNDEFITVAETGRLVKAFAGLGTWKIRLTGGEPTVRPDFVSLAETVSSTPGIRRVAFTTNGYKLPERARSYYASGLRAINISIDSLDPRRFHEITGHNRLFEVVEGVNAALNVGFESVKINTVLLKGLNDDELDGFLAFVESRPVSLRFIELMQTGDNLSYFRKHHIPAAVIRSKLAERGWALQERAEGAGPAVEYAHPAYAGRIGLIAPYAKDFCNSCNRLRVSSRGALHLCLFGSGGYDLRPLLQADDQIEELKDKILSLMQFKRSSHFLHEGDTGVRRHLASIGG